MTLIDDFFCLAIIYYGIYWGIRLLIEVIKLLGVIC